jgi:beta-lactamase superfamily II metal-dependent hydrolase
MSVSTKKPVRKTGVPSSVTIRMYNVGFGDCFLLTFSYANRDRHMLIDYGSTAAPRSGGPKYMTVIAKEIQTACNGKLDVLVATHRHRDHISGFATNGEATGKIIAALEPDHVIQPWTEDPSAPADALTATTTKAGKNSATRLQAQYLGALEDMHSVAASIAHLTRTGVIQAGAERQNQLTFLGENNLKNPSAVKNLMSMGAAGKAWYVNAGMKLNGLLPGVKITVLGPPTLEQTQTIRKQRARDPNEFWQFRSFWASQSMAASSRKKTAGTNFFANHKALPRASRSPNTRWFIERSRQIHADQALELVRDLDSVMNNTSVILLLEVGDRKLLFPGDAQIENWSFALSNVAWRSLLKDVNLYKVGHHGSLNATPKTLWKLFDHKGVKGTANRLETLCSTKSGKHGSSRSGTEVPRAPLVEQLDKESDYCSTEHLLASEGPAHILTIPVKQRRKPRE